MTYSERDKGGNVGGIKSMSFDYRGKKTSPAEVFDIIYSPFDDLIGTMRDVVYKNTNQNSSQRRMRLYGSTSSDLPVDELDKRSNFAKRKSFENAEGLVALVHFTDGRRESYNITPRTNYDPTQLKRPNIVYLQCPSQNQTLMLREARTYGEDKLALQRLTGAYKPHFKGDLIPNKKQSTYQDKNKISFVSEPFLTMALEQLRLSGIGSRITPKVRLVDADNQRAWFVRDFIPSINDSPVRDEDIGRYFGTLNGLGLMDFFDCNVPHYCMQSGDVVNIDPDYICHTASKGIISNIWGETRQALLNPLKESKLNVNVDINKVNHARMKAIETTQQQLGGKSLLDFIPTSLTEARITEHIGLDH